MNFTQKGVTYNICFTRNACTSRGASCDVASSSGVSTNACLDTMWSIMEHSDVDSFVCTTSSIFNDGDRKRPYCFGS